MRRRKWRKLMKKQIITLSLLVLCLSVQTQYADTKYYNIVQQEETILTGEVPEKQTPTELSFTSAELAKKKTPAGAHLRKSKKGKKHKNIMSLFEFCMNGRCVLEENDNGVFTTEEFNTKHKKRYVGTAN